MEMIEWIGILAGSLTSMSSIPQLIKLLRTKDAVSLSLTTYIVSCIGCSLWLAYGISMGSLSLILFNIINVGTTLSVIVFGLKCNKKQYNNVVVMHPVDDAGVA